MEINGDVEEGERGDGGRGVVERSSLIGVLTLVAGVWVFGGGNVDLFRGVRALRPMACRSKNGTISWGRSGD